MFDANRPTNGLPCIHPECGSSDAAGYVSPAENDVMYCFSCNKSWKGEGESKGEPIKAPSECAFAEPTSSDFIMGDVKALTGRKIKESTCAFFNYQCGNNNYGKPIQIANYYSPKDSSLVGQQYRTKEKDFVLVNGASLSFFWGQHKFPKGRRVVITEGQIDTMSVWQTLNGTWPVVSLPHGVGSVGKAFKAQQEWLSQWDEIVLCFDMDEAGQKAVEEAVKYCPPGKVHVVGGLACKDASEMLQNGLEGQLREALWKPRKWQPVAIVNSKDVTSAFLTEQTMGELWPWKGLNDLTFGRHAGCVYAVASAPGAGKTDLLTEVITADVSAGKRVGAIFLEEAPEEVKELVVSKVASTLLYYPDCNITMAEKASWETKWDNLPGELFMLDMTKSDGTWESIEPLIQHLIVAEGCTTIILDSMTVAWDNHSDTSEEYRQRTYKAFTRLIKSHRGLGVHGIAASHLNKPPNTQAQHTAGAQIKQSHFYGSQAIPKLSTFCLGLERNQESEDPMESNLAKVRVVKARKFGRSGGKVCLLRYNSETGRLNQAEESPFDEQPSASKGEY